MHILNGSHFNAKGHLEPGEYTVETSHGETLTLQWIYDAFVVTTGAIQFTVPFIAQDGYDTLTLSEIGHVEIVEIDNLAAETATLAAMGYPI